MQRLGNLPIVFVTRVEGDSDREFEFWRQALGQQEPRKGRLDGHCSSIRLTLAEVAGELMIYIESDDLGADVARFEKFGARVKARLRNRVVMEAPSGDAFCVARTHGPKIPACKVVWN